MTNTTEHDKLSMKRERFLAAKAYGGVLNMTPHEIVVAGVSYPPSGIVARVSETYTDIIDGVCTVNKGKVSFFSNSMKEEIPLSGYDCEGFVHIVSAMVFEVTKSWITGVWVTPATGHPGVVRNDKGHIVEVPCFLI